MNNPVIHRPFGVKNLTDPIVERHLLISVMGAYRMQDAENCDEKVRNVAESKFSVKKGKRADKENQQGVVEQPISHFDRMDGANYPNDHENDDHDLNRPVFLEW